MITDWDMTDWEGVPEITPIDEFRVSPVGRDPDRIENEGSYPWIVGVIEKESSIDRT